MSRAVRDFSCVISHCRLLDMRSVQQLLAPGMRRTDSRAQKPVLVSNCKIRYHMRYADSSWRQVLPRLLQWRPREDCWQRRAVGVVHQQIYRYQGARVRGSSSVSRWKDSWHTCGPDMGHTKSDGRMGSASQYSHASCGQLTGGSSVYCTDIRRDRGPGRWR